MGEGGRAVPRQDGPAGPRDLGLKGYPMGQEDYPVSGVSWYEAAAYAEFAGKSFPLFRCGILPLVLN